MRSRLRADYAQDLAERLLAPCPERLLHTEGVARRAALLASALGISDPDLLVAAAWLHDIGYAPAVRQSGFHPLDGALLLDCLRWGPDVSRLVAHHSGARFVADVRGLGAWLRQYPFDDSALMDALTFADQTVGPGGRLMTVEDRMREMLRRHGPDSPNARAFPQRAAYLRAAARRVQLRLPAPKRGTRRSAAGRCPVPDSIPRECLSTLPRTLCTAEAPSEAQRTRLSSSRTGTAAV